MPGYGDNIRLGTAVSVSGAAASPNAGYHSSPLVAFLMTCSTPGSGSGWEPGPGGMAPVGPRVCVLLPRRTLLPHDEQG